MSTQYRLVQSGKTASGGCSAGPRFVRAVAPLIIIIIIYTLQVAHYAQFGDKRNENIEFRHLNQSGNYMHHLLFQSITMHFVFMGFVCFSLSTVFISSNNINQLIFVMVKCVADLPSGDEGGDSMFLRNVGSD
jgi:hypothetical protein